MSKYGKYYIIGGVLLIAAIGTWYYTQFKLAMDYSFDFVKGKTKLKRFSIDSVIIDSAASLTNKSALAIDIDSFTTDVYLNDIFITHIVNKFERTVAPYSTVEIPLQIAANPSKLITLDNYKKLANYFIAAGGIGAMNVTFKGDVSLKTSGVVVKNYPYETKYTINELRA